LDPASVHDKVALVIRPVAVTTGAAGSVRTAVAAVAAPLPDTFVAATEKVYDVFGVSPVMVAVVPEIPTEPPPVTAYVKPVALTGAAQVTTALVVVTVLTSTPLTAAGKVRIAALSADGALLPVPLIAKIENT